MPGFAEAFGLTPAQRSTTVEVKQVGVRAGGVEGANVLWQGEEATFEFEVTNRTDTEQNLQGFLETIHYRTEVKIGDWWVPHVYRLGLVGKTPVAVRLAPRATRRLKIKPLVPQKLG